MHMNILLKASTYSSIVFILSACAGGGGGGGGSSAGGVTVTPFTSWSAIQPNSTVVATSLSAECSPIQAVWRSPPARSPWLPQTLTRVAQHSKAAC